MRNISEKKWKLITLLLCLVFTLGSPLTVLAENAPETQEDVPSDETPAEAGSESQAPTAGTETPTADTTPAAGTETPAEDTTPVAGADTPAADTTPVAGAETPAEDTTPAAGTDTPAVNTTPAPADGSGTPAVDTTPVTSSETTPGTGSSPAPTAEAAPSSGSSATPATGVRSAAPSAGSGTADTPGLDPTDGEKKVIDPSYVDAEKYSFEDEDEGYDTNLCWAATAANMLWTANYAQQAVNPLTNDYFKSEDEVYDYFRKCFTDEAGNPQAAINYFTNNIYKWEKDDAKLKSSAPEGGLLPDIISNDDLRMVFNDDENLMEALGDLTQRAAGALLRWWDGVKMSDGAHWLTVTSLEKTDGTFTGIWFADSDNDTAVEHGKKGSTDAEKAALAAGMPNSYTYYPLSYELVDGTYYWVVVGYDKKDKTLITYICTLENYMENGGGQDDRKSDDSDSDSTGTVIIPSVNVPVNYLTEDYAKIAGDIMASNNMYVLSVTNGIYDRTAKDAYSLFVRRSVTMLSNVYLDGTRLSGDKYTIKGYSNGTFSITLNSDFMSSLGSGSHTLRMEFGGKEAETSTFVVK